MTNEYCKYCWAKDSRGGCFAAKETRVENCRKAKMRANEKINNNESKGLKDYLTYITNRIDYLKVFNMGVPSSEYKYYLALRKVISQWGKNHIVFYKYLRGEIDMDYAKSLYGVSEKEFYRITRLQRKKLIKFIEEHEKVLGEKHPFIPMTDIFNENFKEVKYDE